MEVDDTDQLLSGQLHELAAAAGINSDLDFAFQIQMQEAITASLTSSPSSKDEIFRVYFKGLVSHETVFKIKMSFAGIGISIRDASDRCIYESRKSYLLDAGGRGIEGDLVELEALIEALNVAVNLGVKRVHIFCDSKLIHQYLAAERQPKSNKIVKLVDQVNLIIQSKFIYHAQFYAKQDDINFVYTLAREAIVSEATKWGGGSDTTVAITEQCTICFEYFLNDQIFYVNKCFHRYCFSCMRKHVEARLLQGKLPECPHEKCGSSIGTESCKKFLKPESYAIMRLRVKEASIPPTEKVYCPFSNCSALMSKTEVKEHTTASSSTSAAAARGSGLRKCVECNRLFCVNCKVPWHDNVACSDYLNSFMFQSSNDAKLKSLAAKERWRECIKCKNLVELATGCYHIHCRCGYEFCYTCGAEWIDKKPTCSCPIWDERYIINS